MEGSYAIVMTSTLFAHSRCSARMLSLMCAQRIGPNSNPTNRTCFEPVEYWRPSFLDPAFVVTILYMWLVKDFANLEHLNGLQKENCVESLEIRTDRQTDMQI